MMARLLGLRFLRVLPPLASTPVGLHGSLMPEDAGSLIASANDAIASIGCR